MRRERSERRDGSACFNFEKSKMSIQIAPECFLEAQKVKILEAILEACFLLLASKK